MQASGSTAARTGIPIGEADGTGVNPHSRCRARDELARHGGLQRGSATPPRFLTDHTFGSGNVCIAGRPSLDCGGQCCPQTGMHAHRARAQQAQWHIGPAKKEINSRNKWRLRLNNMRPVPIPGAAISSGSRDAHIQPPARAFKVGCIGAVEGKNKRGRIVVHCYLHDV